MKKIKLIEVDSELGAGTRGASLGLTALKVAANKLNSSYFDEFEQLEIYTNNDVLNNNVSYPNAKYIKHVSELIVNYSFELKDLLLKENIFPIVLSGDHSTAAGTIAGIKRSNPNKEVGVVWIDAHADIHSPFSTPSGNLHGMPLAASSGLDNIKYKKNEVSEECLTCWNTIKNVGGISPKIKPENIVYVGVRDIEEEEKAIIEEYSIKNFTVEEIRSNGVLEVAKSVLNHLHKCDVIYLSFDVDVLDSSLSTGTGTPVENGLWLNEVEGVLSHLLKSEKIGCFEMVEINPFLDNKGNLMAEMAFQILKKCTLQIIKTHNIDCPNLNI